MPKKEDAVQKVRDLTDGYGCDVYIEATGAPAAVAQGLYIFSTCVLFLGSPEYLIVLTGGQQRQ